jgi:ABC-2 type transport system permease protein
MFPIFRLLVRDVTATFDKSLVVIQLVLPLLFLFVAGYSYTNLIPPFHVNGVTINYQQFLAAGVILQTVMTGSLFAGLLLWIDRRLGMFEQILMGPFTRSQYAFSKILASMLVGLGGALIMLVFAAPFFLGFPLSLPGVLIALTSILLAALFFGSFAMVLTSMLKSNEAFNTVINLLFVVFTFVSSTFYPVESAPKVLQGLLLLNPLSYADDMLRLGLYGLSTGTISYEILALVSETTIAFGLAVYTFRRIKITDR